MVRLLLRLSKLRTLISVTVGLSIASAGKSIRSTHKTSSGLIVDTLAAQLYDRLLDVDPTPIGWCLSLLKAGRCWITAQPTASICVVTFSFRRRLVHPTRKLNADDVVFTFERIFDRHHPWHNVNGSSFPTSTACSLPITSKACANWTTTPLNSA